MINCTAANCLTLTEDAPHIPTSNIDPGGEISGFTLQGSGSASQIGIISCCVQGERWYDLVFSNFTGTGAISWYLNNSSRVNGWQERITAAKIRVLNGNGIKFDYYKDNGAAISFGYAYFQVSCDGATTCFDVHSGRLYNSDLSIIGNVPDGASLISVEGDMDLNRYFITAEARPPSDIGKGSCINVAIGGEMEGTE